MRCVGYVGCRGPPTHTTTESTLEFRLHKVLSESMNEWVSG